MHIKQTNRIISTLAIILVGLATMVSPALTAPGEWTKVYGAVMTNQSGVGLEYQEEYHFSSFDNHWSNFFTRLTSGEYVFPAFSKAKSVYTSKINRLSTTGKLLSTKALHLVAIAATSDGGYIGLNVAKAGYDSNKDAKITYSLIKFKKNNQVEWKKTIPAQPNTILTLRLVTVTAHGNYVVGGISFDKSSMSNSAYLIKFLKNGTLEKEFIVASGAEDPIINSLRPSTSDEAQDGIILAGHKTNMDNNSTIPTNATMAWVAKLDDDLNLSWENTFGCQESATYAEETSEGNIVVASNVRTGYSTDPKSWNPETERLYSAGRISTFDAEGNLVSEGVHQALFPEDSQVQGCLVKEGTQDNYVENPVAYAINMVKPTSDGGLFLVGTRSTGIKSAQQKDQVWVRKIDAEGAVLWDKTFTDAGGGKQYGLTGFQTSPTQYTVVGTKKNGQRVVRSFVGK